MSDTKTLPYFKPTPSQLELKQGEIGCREIFMEDVCLRFDKPPPALKGQPPEPPKPKPAPEPFAFFDRIAKAYESLTSPAPPVPPPPPKPKITVPPFDIQDIPKAMRKMGWLIAAFLMEKWFAGKANRASNKEGEEGLGIDTNGKPFTKEFIDTTTVKMAWALQYPVVQRAIQTLTNTAKGKGSIYNDLAQKTLRRKLLVYFKHKYPYYPIHTAINGIHSVGDVQAVHRLHFQHTSIKFIDEDYLGTDLHGALGDFAVYAAPAYSTIETLNYPRTGEQGVFVTVNSIYVYIRDEYSFEGSQYLGHWGKEGVIFVQKNKRSGQTLTEAVVTTVSNLLNYTKYMYSTFNQNFLGWRQVHKRGGDFVIYSDVKLVQLERPLYFFYPANEIKNDATL